MFKKSDAYSLRNSVLLQGLLYPCLIRDQRYNYRLRLLNRLYFDFLENSFDADFLMAH